MTLLDYLKTLLNLRFMTETTPIVLESFRNVSPQKVKVSKMRLADKPAECG